MQIISYLITWLYYLNLVNNTVQGKSIEQKVAFKYNHNYNTVAQSVVGDSDWPLVIINIY